MFPAMTGYGERRLTRNSLPTTDSDEMTRTPAMPARARAFEQTACWERGKPADPGSLCVYKLNAQAFSRKA